MLRNLPDILQEARTLAAEQLVRMGYENVTVITCPIDIIVKTHSA